MGQPESNNDIFQSYMSGGGMSQRVATANDQPEARAVQQDYAIGNSGPAPKRSYEATFKPGV